MIVRQFARRVVLGAVVAAVLVPALAPLAGVAGWSPAARAADPAAVHPVPAPGADSIVPNPRPMVIWHGPRTERLVALTFDDGWSPATLREIYRTLVRERVPATFFVTGVYVQRAPALWRQIAAAGFPLANHSYLHRDTRVLTPHAVAVDLARTRQVVETATGRPMLPYYRPPYGFRNGGTDRLAAAAGFPYVILWDTTGADTARRPTVASVVRDATHGRPGSIVLLHAGPSVTPLALPAIIASYRARGFRFVTLPEMLGAPPAVGAPVAGAPAGEPAQVPGTGASGSGADGPAIAAEPSRAIDRVAEATSLLPAGGPVAVPPAGQAVGPGPGGDASPPAQPGAIADPSPPARDAAWARRDGTPATIAVVTVVVLVLLVAAGAVAGRSAAADDRGA